MENFWTAERDSILRQCALDGKSAAQAGAIIGKTRSAVLGRASRIGVSFKGPNSNQYYKDRAAEDPDYKPTWVNGKRTSRRKSTASKRKVIIFPTSPEPIAAPVISSKTIMDIGTAECRYVFGDGPFFFCGAATGDPDVSWCPFHARIVFDRTATAQSKIRFDLSRATKKIATTTRHLRNVSLKVGRGMG